MIQKRVPIYKTMFSELRNYPRYEVRLDTVDPVPRFSARQWRERQSQAQDALHCQRLLLHLSVAGFYCGNNLKFEDCLVMFHITNPFLVLFDFMSGNSTRIHRLLVQVATNISTG